VESNDSTFPPVRTVKNPYDQVVNNAINSQQELHSKDNAPQTIHSPAADATETATMKEGATEPTAENTQSIKMDAEFASVDQNPSSVLEEVGSMDTWSEGLKDRVKTVKDGGRGDGVKTGEVEIDPGASTILNLKDS